MNDPSKPLRPRIWLRRILWAALGLVTLLIIVVVTAKIAVETVFDGSEQNWGATGLSAVMYSTRMASSVDLAKVGGSEIQRAAGLSLQTREFDHSRAATEEIVRRQNGQLQQFQTLTRAGTGRVLTASIRVPADRADETLKALRALGTVKEEAQSGETVDVERVNLEAQIANAKATLDRLNQIGRSRSGPVGDLLALEKEISGTRAEIQQIEARLHGLVRRTRWAAIQFRLAEEYAARFTFAWSSARQKFRNSAVEGLDTATTSLLVLASVLLGYGPAVLVWCGLLFFPGRWAWRRLKSHGEPN